MAAHFFVAFIAVDIVAVDVTLHRNCPRHTLRVHVLTLTYFSRSIDFDICIQVESAF